MDDIEGRLAEGRITVQLGNPSVALPPKLAAAVVRISCDVPRESFGPLIALDERVSFLSGEPERPLVAQARSQVFELGRRVLGDAPPPPSPLGRIVASVNRLAKGRAVVVLDAVDAADEATLEALTAVVSRPGWLRVPLLLGVRASAPEGSVASLVSAIERAQGPDSIVRRDAPEPRLVPTSELDPETRSILRAASVLGAAFELDLLADLVGRDRSEVLGHLQLARDAGLALDDRGGGTFAMDAAQADLLRATTLPTLRASLHERAAALLSPREVSPAAAPLDDRPASPGYDLDVDAKETKMHEVSSAQAADPEPASRARPDGDRAAERAPEAPVASAAAPRAVGSTVGVDLRGARAEAHARASEHLYEAGDVARGVERALLAAQKAAGLGAHAEAEALARRAVEATNGLPASARARALRVRALLSLGRIRLEGFAPTASFDLAAALEPLQIARRTLAQGDDPELHVEAARLLAAVELERGDAASLDDALAVLVDASQTLLAEGAGARATRLLSDQAAVYLRMGDPVRAMALLQQSRGVFERRADEDPVARRELAETDHLIARIPLHVAARPGRKDDALSSALDHALAARRVFSALGDALEAARVAETMGRLELERGRLDKAIEHLKAALLDQERLADLVGLARTSAALSATLLAAGRGDDALSLLADSIELNERKGSAIGIAFNRRAFDAAVAALPRLTRPLVDDVRARLERAEATLGTIALSGARDR